jgi:hypothetical protein
MTGVAQTLGSSNNGILARARAGSEVVKEEYQSSGSFLGNMIY